MAAERKLSAAALAVRDVMCGDFGMGAGVSRDAAILRCASTLPACSRGFLSLRVLFILKPCGSL